MAISNLKDTVQILVVDDEPDLRTLYELTLLREGYQVRAAGDIQEATELLAEQRFDLVITDMRLPDGSGIDLLREIRTRQRSERCVVITAFGSAENAVESLKEGAFDYLTKPVDLKQFRAVVAAATEATVAAVAKAHSPGTDARQAAHSRAPAAPVASVLGRMAGVSAGMQLVKERVMKVARSMAPVLIQGESGTGKELVALALHANSHRAGGPWLAVNCGAIPENLLEAEFFGARKGAYTGASQDRIGFFQAANGGTLFLDEIGDLPLAMQAKLLRAIQERRVRPIGATQEELVDVRIISATHKDLSQEISAGRFRQDLYYRLNVIDISIPPLRERPEDVPALCEALLERIARESNAPQRRLSAEALARLSCMPLKGNVRELENILHRAVALSDEVVLDLADCSVAWTEQAAPATASSSPDAAPEEVLQVPREGTAVHANKSDASLPSDLQAHLDTLEREILVRALQQTGFNRTAAANLLGLSLRQMRYRIARLNIDD
jgi:two-component system response regulator PilR (NtrC family)